MPGERIIPGKCLLLRAQVTPYLDLASVVNGVFVSGEIVGAREDGVAWLAGTGIDALAFVRARLGVAHG